MDDVPTGVRFRSGFMPLSPAVRVARIGDFPNPEDWGPETGDLHG